MLLYMKGLVRIIATFRAEKILCMFASCTKHPFEGSEIISTEKERIESLHFSEG